MIIILMVEAIKFGLFHSISLPFFTATIFYSLSHALSPSLSRSLALSLSFIQYWSKERERESERTQFRTFFHEKYTYSSSFCFFLPSIQYLLRKISFFYKFYSRSSVEEKVLPSINKVLFCTQMIENHVHVCRAKINSLTGIFPFQNARNS